MPVPQARALFVLSLLLTVGDVGCEDRATRARRKELCPDLSSWEACQAREAQGLAEAQRQVWEKAKAAAASQLAAARQQIARAWSDFDARPQKDRAALLAAFQTATVAANSAPTTNASDLRTEARLAGRQRAAPVMDPEARLSPDRDSSLIPASDTTQCVAFAAKWVGDSETASFLDTLGFVSLDCGKKTWKVSAVPQAQSQALRATILAVVAELRTLVGEQARIKLRPVAYDECQKLQERAMNRASASLKKIPDALRAAKTRFAARAPNLGQTFEEAIYTCVGGCIIDDPDDDSDPGNKVGREMVIQDCRQAATALDDLATATKGSQ
jgi:hypothetical protein